MARELKVKGQNARAWQAQALLQREERYRADFDTKVNTSAPDDTKVTQIQGLLFLADGRLVLIDSKNKCIKVIKANTYDKILRHSLDEEPRGLTSTSDDGEIFITFYYTYEVKKFQIGEGNNVIAKEGFKVREKPFSISFSKNTLAIEIGEGDDGAILITDMNGIELKKISGVRRNFGMFTGNTIRLTHDHDASCFYVTDVVNDCINCVDYSGVVKWTAKMQGPRGIAMYEKYLVVACKTDNTVCLVEKENGKFTTLLSTEDKVSEPRFIACEPSKRKIAVEVGISVVHIYNGFLCDVTFGSSLTNL